MEAESPRTLRSGFLHSCEHHGDRIALEVAGETLTYLELRERAAGLAATLIAHDPREPGSAAPALTAVLGQRSSATFAGILAALFRGDGYVPLNPTFPPERTRSMLERSGCRALIVDAGAESQLDRVLAGLETSLLLILPESRDVTDVARAHPRHRVLGRDDLEAASAWSPRPVDPEAIAYLLFTSGSTGRPKGVMVRHRNVQAFLDVMAERYGITPDDRFSQTFELTFDLSVFDLFLAWKSGARVCVPSQAQKMLPAKYIQESKLTVWFSVPSTGVLMSRLRMLKPDAYPSLRWSLFCGEALPVEIVEAWVDAAPNSTVENLYGPTELTIACTLYRWDPARSREDCELGLVPIGEPYPGMEVLVVDEELREVAPGETGELLMSGPQLTPGYWNDPERTAAAYQRPPGRDRVFYRTGDRVRRSNGRRPMVYLGRMDNQIKIQGYRVELGEIEAMIRREAGVEVAIAVGWPITSAGADSVVVFISDPGVDCAELLTRAKSSLPAYMAPREIRQIPDFPLNANGKVDRKALLSLLEAD
ncbi:MAG TPA: amino acid adenylation domain-containing protein [Deltaproteobacteria bacterium]|nr:amino acid adenylation domain-containing protein [Deltaproteobacteria bacterium]